MKQKLISIVFEYIGLAIGSVIMSLGLVLFLIPGRIAQITHKYSNVSIGTGILIVDFFIISLAGLALHDINLALYGFISLYFSSKVLNLILDGIDCARSFYIISERQDDIIEAITNDMGRGGTEIYGKGFYTRKDW